MKSALTSRHKKSAILCWCDVVARKPVSRWWFEWHRAKQNMLPSWKHVANIWIKCKKSKWKREKSHSNSTEDRRKGEYVLNLQLGESQLSLRFCWTISLINLKLSFKYTATFLWFYWNTEPSTLICRAFAIVTPSARQVDAEPSATSWIQRKGSVNPQMRFW